jgi:dipeptidase
MMRSPIKLGLAVWLGFISAAVRPASGCTVIAVGKKASADGSVIVSHTDTCNNSRIFVVPGRAFRKGELAPVYYGIQDPRLPLRQFGEVIGHIPQAERTYAYFHSGYPHLNEHQLAIGESTLSQREELQVERSLGARQIMTVEQAMAFALQRCRTAREAVKLIGSLMETYGFLPSTGPESEGLAIADTQEVWIMEIFGVGPLWEPATTEPGAIWAAQRLPDDQITIIPNWSIIKTIDPGRADEFMVSPNYLRAAVDRGWYDPNGGRPFIWQEVYAPLPREWSTGRFWLFYSKFAPGFAKWPERSLVTFFQGQDAYHQYVEPLSLYPFAVKPERKVSVQDVMAFQRSVFEGTIYDMTADKSWYVPGPDGRWRLSPLTTPFPTRDQRELLKLTYRRTIPRGNYGMIAQLRGWLPDPVGGIYWVYLDNAYVSPYVPIYAGVREISPLYSTYDPDAFSEDSARWVYDFVENLLYLKWQEAIQDVRAVRDPYEAAYFEHQPAVEAEALSLQSRDPARAAAYLTDLVRRHMEALVKMYRDLRYRLITKYTNNKQGL